MKRWQAIHFRSWLFGFGLIATTFAAQAQVINEFVANHTGTDNYSYVEVSGLPSTDYSAFTVVEIQGDSTDGDDELG